MSIYYEDDLVTLHHGDALDILPTLTAGTIDACVTDPPYVIGAVSAGNMASKSGGWADMMNHGQAGEALTEVRFWLQVIGDARRTVLCSPEMESRCKGYVDARGLGGLITVKASPGCPDDRLYVIDEQAITATLSRPLRLGMVSS